MGVRVLDPYNTGLYGDAPPERGTFFRLETWERGPFLMIEVWKTGANFRGNLAFESVSITKLQYVKELGLRTSAADHPLMKSAGRSTPLAKTSVKLRTELRKPSSHT